MKKIVFGLFVIIFLLTGCVPIQAPSSIAVLECEQFSDTELLCHNDSYQIVYTTDIFEGNKTLDITVLATNQDKLFQGMVFAEKITNLAPAPAKSVNFPTGLRFAGIPDVWEVNSEIDNLWATRKVELSKN